MDKEGPLTRFQANKFGIKLPQETPLPARRKSPQKKDVLEMSTSADSAELNVEDAENLKKLDEGELVDENKIESIWNELEEQEREDQCEVVCFYCPCNCSKKKIGGEVKKVDENGSEGVKRKRDDDVKDGKTKTKRVKLRSEPEPLQMSELMNVCALM